jgi:hypothetical protein
VIAATTRKAGKRKDTEEVNAYRYHLDRVTSQFKLVISAENAELLAALLGSDDAEHRDVA